ncbi:hypothetical protein SETIT_1G060100v2 [Setaria italica]|uniref:Uncharacterized protein n=1 Tax=Setaria italica TaxID=4555 RepID=A0A368PHB9_SETIT|nr:hypothetical protein SETIT_1G060100v2 [Setaria italica]
MIQSGHPRAVKISDVSHTKKYRCISTSRLIFRMMVRLQWSHPTDSLAVRLWRLELLLRAHR